jgi:hypothetical protein
MTHHVFQVEPIGDVQVHDVSWIRELQRSLDKNNLTFPPIEWMDWNENTLRYLCRHYWYGEASHQPVWEYLVPEARVVKAVGQKPF